jgi:L-amino acid N-acyltransferase YncA
MERISEIIKEDLPEECLERYKVEKLATTYLKSFRGFPWFERSLSIDDVNKRLEFQLEKPGLQIFIIENKTEEIVAAGWFDTPTLDEVEKERGLELKKFAMEIMQTKKINKLIWEREILVSPDYQNMGLGTRIRTRMIEYIDQKFNPNLIITRMRDDNFPIIKIAEKLNFKRTGITKSSSQVPGINHEYWYRTEGSQ